MGSRRWIVMAATNPPPVSNSTPLGYGIAQACPCTHVVTGLMPATTYQITLIGGAGGAMQVASDDNAVLTFETNDPATSGVEID
jgi:hypothetical protein